MRWCCAQDLGSYAQGQGHNQVSGQNPVSAITRKTTETNLTKLKRKTKHHVAHKSKVPRPKVKLTVR